MAIAAVGLGADLLAGRPPPRSGAPRLGCLRLRRSVETDKVDPITASMTNKPLSAGRVADRTAGWR